MTHKFHRVFFIVLSVAFSAVIEFRAQASTNFPPVNKVIADLIFENGGVLKGLPKFSGPADVLQRIKKDDEGAQILMSGNQLEPLISMFKEVYGEPAFVGTNRTGKSIFVYNTRQMGVGLNCSIRSGNGKTITHLIILGSKSVKTIAGGSASSNHGERKSELGQSVVAKKLTAEELIKAATDYASRHGLQVGEGKCKVHDFLCVYFFSNTTSTLIDVDISKEGEPWLVSAGEKPSKLEAREPTTAELRLVEVARLEANRKDKTERVAVTDNVLVLLPSESRGQIVVVLLRASDGKLLKMQIEPEEFGKRFSK